MARVLIRNQMFSWLVYSFKDKIKLVLRGHGIYILTCYIVHLDLIFFLSSTEHWICFINGMSPMMMDLFARNKTKVVIETYTIQLTGLGYQLGILQKRI